MYTCTLALDSHFYTLFRSQHDMANTNLGPLPHVDLLMIMQGTIASRGQYDEIICCSGSLIKDTTQMAYQADGITPLDVDIFGETTITFTHDDKTLTFQGLVDNDINVDLLGGVPFLEMNAAYCVRNRGLSSSPMKLQTA